MKTKFAILFILNTTAIILLTYISLYEIGHHPVKILLILSITLTAISIFTFFRLYFKYMGSPAKNSNLGTKI